MDIKEDKLKEEMNDEEKEEIADEVEQKTEDDVKSNEETEKESSIEKELENKAKEIEDLNEMYLRLQADFVNYKKRVEKEKESIYSYASEEIINSLLPIVDNFERALSSSTNKEDSFYEGMDMIYKQLLEVLEKNGLEEIEALHCEFDPNYHHAVFQEESEEHEEGIVLEVFQKGYKLNDKVIRPSMVKVAK
ncbi:MAG: nucleotide exchange factor GrpE [Clostridiaceae bacterium]|nr:nucleotide exchange factor GrpE [Clostridiaceae bacterium]MBW4859635.1 nucleotide exchange factor GrpE [Clostridiaceae bacterium]MBW4868604.1 nucleotide exchange factor GrpE [Clostridiaceae bacterium]